METDALSTTWVYWLSALAGFVGFTKEFSWDDSTKRNLLKLLGRTLISIFTGLMSYQFALALGATKLWLPLAVGLGAWRGDRALQVMAEWTDKIASKRIGARRQDK